ncbi:MAG TPA: hypothetical protein VF661_02895 [Actinomycetales bacterium]
MHDPLATTTIDDPQLLLLWAARVREAGLTALSESAVLTRALEQRALEGPAADALAELGAAVALGVGAAGRSALEAADQLTRAAHRARLAVDAAAAAEHTTAAAAAAAAAERAGGR